MVDDSLIDLTQDRATLRALYAPPAGQFSRVDVPKLPFAILDGEGPPEPGSIEIAVKALYTAIYSIRREARTRMGKSFVEPPVEILYWADDMRDLAVGNRETWHWRVQITLPVWANAQRLKDSAQEARQDLGDLPALRWALVHEGECVQYLHIGPTHTLAEIVQGLYADYLPHHKLDAEGAYHEIYLDDWSRVAPAQRKIILRQPVCARV
ncbi:GyrI-like domain-containing protein [Woodsholea maritima]|uniref:GyrI-like domain-containing protein n=1 Tax=Woodsholea maritima TaxID=240237 RepID=UPI00037DB34A|nr:GyrI-like domain-containing protein [Woodsholea maritima]